MFSVKKAAWNAKQLIRLKSPFPTELIFHDSYRNSFERGPSLLDLGDDLLDCQVWDEPWPVPHSSHPSTGSPSSVSWWFICLLSSFCWIFSSGRYVLENLPCEASPAPTLSGDTMWRADPPAFLLMCIMPGYKFGHQLCWWPINISCFITSLYLGSPLSKIRIMTLCKVP